MSAKVIPFPGRYRRQRRPSRPSRSAAGFPVPFSAAQMRVIARELSAAAAELLEAQGPLPPACLLAFLDWCWELRDDAATSPLRGIE